MRPELDLNDPETRRQRTDRLSRLGTSSAEHTYLHSTIDDAVADLQSRSGCLLWAITLQVVILSVAVVLLALRPL